MEKEASACPRLSSYLKETRVLEQEPVNDRFTRWFWAFTYRLKIDASSRRNLKINLSKDKLENNEFTILQFLVWNRDLF